MGLLDYREADLRDRRWWTRVRWAVDYLSSQHCIKIYEHKLQQQLALLPTLTDDRAERCWKNADRLRHRIINEMAPWVTPGGKSLRDVALDMRQQWADIWGDPDDPAVQAEMNRLLAAWEEVRDGYTRLD